MIKKVKWISLIILGIILLYFSQKFILNYGSYALNKIKVNQEDAEQGTNEALVLYNLEELTSIPILGNYFLEDKLKVLVNQKKWKQVLKENLNVGGILAINSGFNLLIYRAIAECATYQFRKCQQTIEQIDAKVPHLYAKISHLDVKNRNLSLKTGRRQESVAIYGDF